MAVVLALAWIVSTMWVGRAQQAPARTGANDPNNFTGKSFGLDASGMVVAKRGFEAAARSNWHRHDAPQVLIVMEGGMRYQVDGQPMRELRQHDTVYLPGGVAHWHGAVPSVAATQVSVQMGPGITWMEKVNDAQYNGTGKRTN
jgi:quercetin dioxygenase-like cupin family protein